MRCCWCREYIRQFGPQPDQWVHITGQQSGKNTCALNPYGNYHAEPETEEQV